MRDYPCDLANRPVAPAPTTSPRLGQNQISRPPLSSVQIPGFGTFEQYQAARSICLSLLSQYDTIGPMMRCAIDDTPCLRRAADEASVLSRKMTSLPQWKQQQCDLIVQMESAAASTDSKSFEVVGTINGFKYFVAEQASSYSLIEDWLCFRPSRGDIGQGDVSSFGLKEVKLAGSVCTVYVNDWLMGRSRAAEKLREKCR